MSGIAKKEECIVDGRIHDINILIPDIGLNIKIPICFSEEDAPFLLSREGFMDYFDITFKKKDVNSEELDQSLLPEVFNIIFL